MAFLKNLCGSQIFPEAYSLMSIAVEWALSAFLYMKKNLPNSPLPAPCLGSFVGKQLEAALIMAPQHLPSTRVAPLGLLLGLLVTSCFTFCLSCRNSDVSSDVWG
ncbi:nucleotide exchange factor SIL1 precursor [Cricetulus griseus]|nr:nucleotide exchange factor SIL1 precursor [Cricetulus griseus]